MIPDPARAAEAENDRHLAPWDERGATVLVAYPYTAADGKPGIGYALARVADVDGELLDLEAHLTADHGPHIRAVSGRGEPQHRRDVPVVEIKVLTKVPRRRQGAELPAWRPRGRREPRIQS